MRKSMSCTIVLLGLALCAGGMLTPARGESDAAMVETGQRRTLTLAGAKAIAAAASMHAKKNSAGGAIAVVDEGGHLLYLERLDGTFPAAAVVAADKARTAATFRKATRDFEEAVRSGRVSLVAVSVMTPLQGGVPVLSGDQVIGAVGVSGAASAQQDEEIARAAAGVIR